MATQHAKRCGAVANAPRPRDDVAHRQFASSRPGDVAACWSSPDPDGRAPADPMTAPTRSDQASPATEFEADSRSLGAHPPPRPRHDRSRSRRAAVRRSPGPVPRSPAGGAPARSVAGRHGTGCRADASRLDRRSGEVPTAPPYDGFVERSSSELLLGPAIVRDHEPTVGKTRASGNRELRQSEVWRTTVADRARQRAR